MGSINRFKGDATSSGYGFVGSLVIIASPLIATDRWGTKKKRAPQKILRMAPLNYITESKVFTTHSVGKKSLHSLVCRATKILSEFLFWRAGRVRKLGLFPFMPAGIGAQAEATTTQM